MGLFIWGSHSNPLIISFAAKEGGPAALGAHCLLACSHHQVSLFIIWVTDKCPILWRANAVRGYKVTDLFLSLPNMQSVVFFFLRAPFGDDQMACHGPRDCRRALLLHLRAEYLHRGHQRAVLQREGEGLPGKRVFSSFFSGKMGREGGGVTHAVRAVLKKLPPQK